MIADNFKNHSIFEKLEQFKKSFSTTDNKTKIDNHNYLFFDAVYKYVNDRLKLTVPLLVQEIELADISNEINSATQAINEFIGSNNVGYLQNAINNLNSSLNRAKNLPVPLKSGDYDFSKTVSTFQSLIEESYKNFKELNLKLQEDIEEIQTKLEQKDNQITIIQQRLSEKETEIQSIISHYNSEFEAIKTNHNNAFESEKTRFNESIEADRKKIKDKFDSDIEENKTTFSEQKSNIETQTSLIITTLNSKLAEANKIVSIVGNVGVTGNFQNIANQHKKSADFFRWVALAFMLLMSSLLIWSIIELSRGSFDVYKSLIRIIAACVLTYPAIYASRESNKHRKLETNNRNLELELASIGPFIELLPEDKKQAIKEDLVKKYFGNQNLALDEKEYDNISIALLERVLKIILPNKK